MAQSERDTSTNEPTDLEQLVLDVTDAHWCIPTRPSERKWCVVKCRNRWLVFMKQPQGTIGAPLAFDVIFGLSSRCVQSLFLLPNNAQSLRLQIFVDDPWAVARGTERERDRHFALLALAWRTLGFPLAFSKGKRGRSLTWIGVQINPKASAAEAEVTAEKISELAALITEALSSNVVSVKAMRTFVGKAQNIAGIIHAWRPFLSNIWGAVSEANAGKRGTAPKGCLWTAQVRSDLEWISEFLAGTKGTISRMFHLSDYLCRGDQVTLVTDASPRGIGGRIKHQGKVIEYFSDRLQDYDLEVLQAERGDCKGQQAFELRPY